MSANELLFPDANENKSYWMTLRAQGSFVFSSGIPNVPLKLQIETRTRTYYIEVRNV